MFFFIVHLLYIGLSANKGPYKGAVAMYEGFVNKKDFLVKNSKRPWLFEACLYVKYVHSIL